MTNQSPPESQNPIPERRKRPATGVTFDEMIAIIVAFTTIGSILFWAIGNKSGNLAGNFGLGGNSSGLLSSDRTTDTNIGLGDKDLERENRELAARLQQEDRAVAYIPANKTVKLPAKAEKRAFSLDSGAKLVPLAGVATLPAVVKKPAKANVVKKAPDKAEIDTPPAAVVPEKTETAVTPETTRMPQDVAPDYWAYPFVKQMREKALVPELAKNQEFDPDALITRASMATLVSQAFEEQPATESTKKFNDVSNKNEIAKDIDKAVSTGFMQGYSDNEFRPLENIPRYQVLVTLATGLGLKPSKDVDQILNQFDDSENMPDWAKQQVAAATEAGLVINPPSVQKGSLAPEKPATRAEVAAMIHQALVKTDKLEPLESEYIVKP